MNRVHRQARVEDEMKHALKVYFKRKDITKDEYKMILRKGVPQVSAASVYLYVIDKQERADPVVSTLYCAKVI